MEISSSVSWLHVCVVTIAMVPLLAFFRRQLRARKLNLPPGPKPWPIIGNLNLIGSVPHQSLHSLSRQFGPLMHLRFGSCPAVVASSADAAKAILQTHDLSFASRPETSAGKYILYDYTDIGFAPYGPYWRNARKLCHNHLFTAKRLDQFKHIRREEIESGMNHIFKSLNEPVNLKYHLALINLNMICRMVLGKKYQEEMQQNEADQATQDEFKDMIGELFYLIGILDIGDSIPWLRFLDLQGNIRRMKVLNKRFDRYLERVLDEHEGRKSNENSGPGDYVDLLLQAAEIPVEDFKLERRGVKAITQDLIVGGTETSATTLEWAMSELIKNPEALKKASSEIEQVVGKSRWVEEEDIPNLPYLNVVVKEVMRLHPAAPMLSPRISRESCNVMGYDIPINTRVFVNVWSIGRDPLIWGDPFNFRPERFVGSSIDMKGHDFELLPFGAGRRVCPGYNLALKMVHGILANLIHGFDWKLPNGMKEDELSMEEYAGLTTPRKFPLVLVAKPRLADELFM